MGRSDELGTVEEGKLADLVILNADPLQDVRNTRAIHKVIKGGQVLHPALCCD
jgi:imidazolonepropionase-like amidohydrolase